MGERWLADGCGGGVRGARAMWGERGWLALIAPHRVRIPPRVRLTVKVMVVG